MPEGTSPRCDCIGQPRSETEPSPEFYECVQNFELWNPPLCSSKIRLAFTWKLFEQGETLATEAETCVVRLDDAERRGVPVPTDFAQALAAWIGAGNDHQGNLHTGFA